MAVSRKAARRQIERGRRQFHDWNWGGKSAIRIFVYAHEWNDWDVLFGRCDQEDVGNTEEHFFVKQGRAWRDRGDKKVWINTLIGKDPYWDEWNALDKETQKKKWKLQPNSKVYFNAFDHEYPQGVQVVALTLAQFMGYTAGVNRRETYGVWNMYDGYNPDEKLEEQEEETEEVEGGSGGSGGLPKLKGKGDALFGINGQDILLYFHKNKQKGYNPAVKNGPVQLRIKKNCKVLTPAEFYEGQVTDLLLDPEFIPGYASDGHHASDKVNEFLAWREGKSTKTIVGIAEEVEEEEETVEEVEEVEEVESPAVVEEETEEVEEVEEPEEEETEEVEEVEQPVSSSDPKPDPTPVVKKKAAKKAKGKTKKFKSGDLVVVNDEGTVYAATFDTDTGKDLETGEVQVIIRVGDQEGSALEGFTQMLATSRGVEPSKISEDDSVPVKVKRNQVTFAR